MHNEAHTALVRDALQELAIAGYAAWKNDAGVWFEENGRPHKYGKIGSGDIICILPVMGLGIHGELEAKTGTGRQSKNQKIHQEHVVERNGGIYIVFRSVPQLLEDIKMELIRRQNQISRIPQE